MHKLKTKSEAQQTTKPFDVMFLNHFAMQVLTINQYGNTWILECRKVARSESIQTHFVSPFSPSLSKSKIVSTHILAGCSFHLKLSRKMRRKKYYSTTKRSKPNCYITTAFQTKKKTFQNASNVSDSHRTIEAKKNYSVVSFSLCFCQFHSNIKSSSTHSNYTDVFIETLLSRSSLCLCSNIHIFFTWISRKSINTKYLNAGNTHAHGIQTNAMKPQIFMGPLRK